MMRGINKILRFKVMEERSGVGAGNSGSLKALRPGDVGRVVEISPECRGFERRRLMDLGLVPGSLVERADRAPFGGPIAFRLRGVTMALRLSDAEKVSVECL
jgi:DtxR family transcriptional regulator, Mn-dependent transcriptional regulator